jgi:hypothetical protein
MGVASVIWRRFQGRRGLVFWQEPRAEFTAHPSIPILSPVPGKRLLEKLRITLTPMAKGSQKSRACLIARKRLFGLPRKQPTFASTSGPAERGSRAGRWPHDDSTAARRMIRSAARPASNMVRHKVRRPVEV